MSNSVSRRRWRRGELAYCSNVHPGESLSELRDVVQRHCRSVRRQRGLPRMDTGLWISAAAAQALEKDTHQRNAFFRLLVECRLSLVTLNGFPFGGFHRDRVKHDVYTPDWSDPARADYTLQLARLLALAPGSAERELTISTLPLGYRPGWSSEHQSAAVRAVLETAAALDQLRQATGRTVRLCLEMEPGCVLESTDQAVAFFCDELPQQATGDGIDPDLVRRHLGVCFDVCHQAVMFEAPQESLTRLVDSGVAIGKIQISSALHVEHPDGDRERAALADFDEARYLHQVRSLGDDGMVRGVMDLPQALGGGRLHAAGPWRVHFHLPIQLGEIAGGQLGTTRHDIEQVLDWLRDRPGSWPQLEVETYTWQVLPDNERPDSDDALHAGLAGEMAWLENALAHRELLGDQP